MLRFLHYSGLIMLVVCGLGGMSSQASAEPSQSSSTASHLSRPEEGLWLVKEKDGIFQIGPCDDRKDRLCGWLVGMDYTEAEPEKDVWGRSECGLQIISDMKPVDNGRWDGHILDPHTGRTYDARLWVAKSGHLKLLGYLGIPMFGQTQTWSRYHGASIGQKCRMKHG